MSSTTHPFTPEEVMAFVDGELSADRAQSISAHIDYCAECQEIVTTFRKSSTALSQWAVPPVSAQLEASVAAAATTNATSSEQLSSNLPWRFVPRNLRRSTYALVATAALVLLALAVSIPTLYRSRGVASEAIEFGRLQTKMATNEPLSRKAQAGLAMAKDSDDPLSGHGDKAKSLPSVDDQATTEFSRMTLVAKLQSVPMIARTVSLSIVVKDFDAARGSLDAILARHEGYAANLDVATPLGTGRTIQASLRIPAPQLVAAVAELKALGRVENESQNGEEVTQQHADLVARLKNSRETEQRLQDVLRTRTGKVKDVLEVEEEIARVRGEIEQMEAEQQTLEHRVNFATIDLKLAEEYKAQLSSPAPSVGMQLRNASVNGFRNASETLLGIILFFAESGPTLLLWALILLIPARLVWRRYQRAHAMS
jgi:hypothetical protein